MISNKQKITLIEANKRISLYCPIGKDYYTADVLMKFTPDKYYMDYIKLDNFLNRLSGLSYTIEEVAEHIYNELQRYEPHNCSVIIQAYSNTHLNVTVTKGLVA